MTKTHEGIDESNLQKKDMMVKKATAKKRLLFQLLSGERSPYDFIFPRRYFAECTGISNTPPAYMFHQTDPYEFENICDEIKRLKITTLTFSDSLDNTRKKLKSLFLTFDDGWSSVWSMAFPIAYRFGIRFTLFVIPELMVDSLECRSTLENKGETIESLKKRDFGEQPMLTWGEIHAMQKSGIVDVQSHTLNHGVVFTSNELIDFSSPYGPFPIDKITPLVSDKRGKDIAELIPDFGTPLFEFGPALASNRRFKDDINNREECISFVKREGGRKYFEKVDWKDSLIKIANNRNDGRWETDSERVERYKNDLTKAKKIIEERLPETKVRVVALPWGVMHPEIPNIAFESDHKICVLAYPFPKKISGSPVILYPRLFGDSIWTLLHGPVRGGLKWLANRKRNKKRVEYGAIP